MRGKKGFKIYYLLLCEGTTEFNIFAYLTKNKFRKLFEKSNIQFSNKVEIVEASISNGRLDGIGSFQDFKEKCALIKERYAGQTLFFMLDKDLDESSRIEIAIQANGDKVQFLEFNSEYLLLNFAEKNPKNPSNFKNLKDFRNYSKIEFKKEFQKKASELKDSDFDLIFSNVTDEKIKATFHEIFSTLS